MEIRGFPRISGNAGKAQSENAGRKCAIRKSARIRKARFCYGACCRRRLRAVRGMAWTAARGAIGTGAKKRAEKQLQGPKTKRIQLSNQEQKKGFFGSFRAGSACRSAAPEPESVCRAAGLRRRFFARARRAVCAVLPLMRAKDDRENHPPNRKMPIPPPSRVCARWRGRFCAASRLSLEDSENRSYSSHS